MTTDSPTNKRSASTTSQWEWAKIRRRPQGPAERSRRGLTPWPRRSQLTITVRELGGSEAWIEVRARGRVWRMPGHRYLIDALEIIWRGDPR